MNLQFFTDPARLKSIDTRRTNKLLQPFADQLRGVGLAVPVPGANIADDAYVNEVIALLTNAACPVGLVETLLTIETAALPSSAAITQEIAGRRIHNMTISSDPLELALDIFFLHPEELARFRPVPQVSPAPRGTVSQASGPAERSNAILITENEIRNTENDPAASPLHDSITPSAPILNRFTDPDLIFSISTAHLSELFQRFDKELTEKGTPRPDRIRQNQPCIEGFAKLFATPELLPEPLLEALLAIQEFALPENKRLLEKLASDANLDDSREPEGWALRLWLRAPFDIHYIRTLSAHIPKNFFDDDIEFIDPDDQSSSKTLPSTLPQAQSVPLPEPNPCPRNRIARLPKDVRDSINRMLDQALPYADILSELGDKAPGVNKSSLSRWKRGPYQLWLKHQHRLEEAGAEMKFALETVRQNENNQIHQATQQIAALRISELFSQLDVDTLKAAVLEDPAILARLADLLPKLSEAGLKCERQRFELAQSKSEASREKGCGPRQRGISAKALRHAEQRLNLL